MKKNIYIDDQNLGGGHLLRPRWICHCIHTYKIKR